MICIPYMHHQFNILPTQFMFFFCVSENNREIILFTAFNLLEQEFYI